MKLIMTLEHNLQVNFLGTPSEVKLLEHLSPLRLDVIYSLLHLSLTTTTLRC